MIYNDLIKLHYGLTSFREQHNKIAELFNELDKIVPTSTIKEDDYIEKNLVNTYIIVIKILVILIT